MYTYKIDLVRRGGFESVESVMAEAENLLNEWARLGWELDKLMPIETNGYSHGAILVFRKQII